MEPRILLVLIYSAILSVTTLISVTEAQNCGCDSGFCCTRWGYCGTGDAYCGDGCQAGPCYTNGICGCASGLCCSRWGYCGTGDAYCGDGCQQGPCYSSSPSPPSTGGNSSTVGDIVTQAFFDGIVSRQASSSCEGKDFYTRDAFVSAAAAYPDFGSTEGGDVAKQEIAAAFAHFTHETGYFCYINETRGGTYCASSTQWPCSFGQQYYGRGPIQITWNYNYGPAGQDIGFDGLNDPGVVASDPVIAFKTGLWFWMNSVHSIVTSGEGFGATIRAINGGECSGGNSESVNNRAALYSDYCKQLGVPPGGNLYC